MDAERAAGMPAARSRHQSRRGRPGRAPLRPPRRASRPALVRRAGLRPRAGRGHGAAPSRGWHEQAPARRRKPATILAAPTV